MAFDPQLGIAEETTPGTGVTVTRFYEYGDCSIASDIDRIEYMGLRPNKHVLGTGNSVPGKVAIKGDIDMPWMIKGMGLIAKYMMGSVVTTTPTGATLARDHTATLGTFDGKSLTIQEGVPFVGGAASPFTWSGCKFTDWELTWDIANQLMAKLTVDGTSESTVTALASASYPTAPNVPFPYVQGVLQLGGAAFDISSFSLKAANNLSGDRYFIRSTTPQSNKEQLDAGIREYTGNLQAEFTSLAAYNRFINHDTTAAIVLTATSTQFIEGATPFVFEVTLPNVRFDGTTPQVQGMQLVEQPLPFKVLDGGGAQGPVILRCRNGDATP